jgi:hypothetical protein
MYVLIRATPHVADLIWPCPGLAVPLASSHNTDQPLGGGTKHHIISVNQWTRHG